MFGFIKNIIKFIIGILLFSVAYYFLPARAKNNLNKDSLGTGVNFVQCQLNDAFKQAKSMVGIDEKPKGKVVSFFSYFTNSYLFSEYKKGIASWIAWGLVLVTVAIFTWIVIYLFKGRGKSMLLGFLDAKSNIPDTSVA